MPEKYAHILIAKKYLYGMELNLLDISDFFLGSIYPDLFNITNKDVFYTSHFIKEGKGFQLSLLNEFCINNYSKFSKYFFEGVRLHIFSDLYVKKTIDEYYSFFKDTINYSDSDLVDQLIRYNKSQIISELKILKENKVYLNDLQENFDNIFIADETNNKSFLNVDEEKYNNYLEKMISEYKIKQFEEFDV
ncbi:hypothetical protein H0R90_12785 [Treponema putidum]|uniref:Uncharacterized protein n=1 Tax=Treponema putidum TaxID=221027 RepID=A0A562SC95_9SPIR|nr:hypothetical protein [Treponema putidum]TWI72360.1 hypothetical protein JM98_02512 [Treponema putidum]TWI78987.1 hypothetical protein JM98_00574 [Treponema putidum]UTY33286.1 hypothetical protein E4N74_04110 [Treponema putidum]